MSAETLIVTLILVIYVISAHIIERKKFKYLHESGLATLLGLVCGLTLYFTQQKAIDFEEELFFNLILPPIIFAAGYSLKKKRFFDNIGMIVYLGIVGTLIQFLFLSTASYLLIEAGLTGNAKLTLRECMLFAAIMSSTDTVAPLSMVKDSAFPVLNSILFGEGVINDAVSILIFRAVSTFEGKIDSSSFLKIGFDFLYLFIMSVLIGIIFGLLNSFLFRKAETLREYPVREVSLILLTAYLSYLVSEMLHFSGIITLFVAGIFMAHYTYHNLSEESKHGTNLVFESVAFLAEAFVFAYLGISIMGVKTNDYYILFGLGIFATCAMGRFLVVLIPILFDRIMRRPSTLKLKEQTIIWYAGLIRGAIAFALSFKVHSSGRVLIISSTMFVVLCTTMAMSFLLQPFSGYMGLRTPEEEEKAYKEFSEYYAKNLKSDKPSHEISMSEIIREKQPYINRSFSMSATTSDKPTGHITLLAEKKKDSFIEKHWKKFDEGYMKPLFVGEQKRETESTDEPPSH